MLRRSSQSRAFTLIEIIVVAALISLLSGIALFSINEMYIRNIRKVSLAETFQLATALSIAENDLQFYPRLNFLRLPRELVLLEETAYPSFGQSNDPDSITPGLDYWGMYRHDSPVRLRVFSKWAGPYMGVSQARQQSNRGAQSGIVKMRIPDLAEDPVTINGADISLVDWPADPFGNPYLLYQLKAVIDDTAGVNIPHFLENPTDDPSWRNIVVSYGRNQVPGGNEDTDQGFRNDTLKPGALYIEGDAYGGEADFTLKVIDRRQISIPRDAAAEAADDALMAAIEATDPELLLANEPEAFDPPTFASPDTTSQHYRVLRSLSLATVDPANYDPATGQVGVIDDGSDDILLEF